MTSMKLQSSLSKAILRLTFPTKKSVPAILAPLHHCISMRQSKIAAFFPDAARALKRDYQESSCLADPVPKEATKRIRLSIERSNSNINLPVPGLDIIHDFVSKDEERQLLDFLLQQNWRTDLARRVIHYGGTYCLMPPRNATVTERKQLEETILKADPMPAALEFIITRFIKNNIYLLDNKPEFCIVNEYTGNQGISAHVENFRFDEPVCGLTLGDGDWMRFHELVKPDDGSVRSGKAVQAEKTGHKEDIWLPPRSLVIMKGDSRYKWQHEIVRSKKGRSKPGWKRTSLTFRVLRYPRQIQ